jgi:diguanylate cyclase (GGDEF)-like protein
MISIRKYLDARDAVPPGTAVAPALPAGSDRLPACLNAFSGTLTGIGSASVEACPALGTSLEANLAVIAESLGRAPSVQAIAAAGQSAQTEVRNWGRNTSRHYRQKAAEVKEILLAMASAALSVGDRDQRCAQQLNEVTANLRSIASLEDISQIRSSIERSASELKGSIDRMTAEGKAVLDRLQSQVATFEARLAEAEQVASSDALTRLRSRSWIETQIEQRIAAATPFSVALLDLDGFKSVNDEHGHVVGDDLLKQFAAELKSACQSTNLVGRWGGDEFLVVLDGSLAQAQAQMERLRDWVCGSYTFNRDSRPLVLQVRASIGVAAFAARDTLKQLLDRADAAMYANKPPRQGSEARR